MFKFLRQGVSPSPDAADSRPASPPSSIPAQDSVRPQSDIQRELIHVVLKDTLRRHGIPFEWLTCEVVTVVQGPGAESLQIQLMLMQWHELFLRYALALEQQLLRGLDRFEPTVDHSKYTISWRFSPDCGCPFHVLPPPLVWSHDAHPESAQEVPSSVLDRRNAARPPKVGTSATPAKPPLRGDDDYQRTELSPFR